MNPMNELIFIIHTVIIALFALGAMAMGQGALVAFTCSCCMLANLFVVKQITLFGLTATCADAFTVGATIGLNLLQEYFGKEIAKKTIWINFFLLIFYAIVSQIHLIYIPHAADTMHLHFMPLLGFMPRIVIASFSVYWLSQMADYYLYGFLKRTFHEKYIIFRNYTSIAICQLLDTILFSLLGLYGIIDNIWEVIIISYMIKLASIIIATPCVGMSRKIYTLTKKTLIVLFILITTSHNNLCMEENKYYLECLKYPQLKAYLERNITTQNDITYNVISPEEQYKTLKIFIATDKLHHLSLCLKNHFNPNRYHKKLSLLHYAIKHNKPAAITILSQYNPDLVPLNNQKQTPLGYAKKLNYTECITAMAEAIKRKYNDLVVHKKHCGLTKHLIDPEQPCSKCVNELKTDLQWHFLWNPCVNMSDLENVIASL